MPQISAGLLMYRIKDGAIQFLLVHPGGPLFHNKDDGVWSIPKGEPHQDEDLLLTAQREFEEETGLKPTGPVHCVETNSAEERQDRPRLGLRGRLRPSRPHQQYLHDGVAAALRPADGVSRDRPGGVLRPQHCKAED